MPKKLEILRIFEGGSITTTYLANELGITQNYARQITLRLKRQGLICHISESFYSSQGYILTGRGEVRITYLANKEKLEKMKRTGMSLYKAVSCGLPKEIESRIHREFNMSVSHLGYKTLDEVDIPKKTMEETGLNKQSKDTLIGYLTLPFNTWVIVLGTITKPPPRPYHLSVEEAYLLRLVTKGEKGNYFVTKEGYIVQDPQLGYLSYNQAVLLADHRKSKRTS
jgi:hypothetical protein